MGRELYRLKIQTDNEPPRAFASLQGIRPLVEIFPLERVRGAGDRRMRADVR